MEKITASDILMALRHRPRCLECNTEIEGVSSSSNNLRWCKPCNSFQTIYRGPVREPLCSSCFNCVGMKGSKPLCAALKYQLPDGSWRDRYNREFSEFLINSGQQKIRKPIKPDAMDNTQYVCECYEKLEEGETRESIEINDPERFYARSRFFSY